MLFQSKGVSGKATYCNVSPRLVVSTSTDGLLRKVNGLWPKGFWPSCKNFLFVMKKAPLSLPRVKQKQVFCKRNTELKRVSKKQTVSTPNIPDISRKIRLNSNFEKLYYRKKSHPVHPYHDQEHVSKICTCIYVKFLATNFQCFLS